MHSVGATCGAEKEKRNRVELQAVRRKASERVEKENKVTEKDKKVLVVAAKGLKAHLITDGLSEFSLGLLVCSEKQAFRREARKRAAL